MSVCVCVYVEAHNQGAALFLLNCYEINCSCDKSSFLKTVFPKLVNVAPCEGVKIEVWHKTLAVKNENLIDK